MSHSIHVRVRAPGPSEAMTVRQLIDPVAFVHAHTEVETTVAMR
jgi:hypothetical protein